MTELDAVWLKALLGGIAHMADVLNGWNSARSLRRRSVSRKCAG